MTAQPFGSCFLRCGRNWRTSTSTARRWMSRKWHFCSVTRIRIPSIELSERGRGRHPPSRGQRSDDLKLGNKCKRIIWRPSPLLRPTLLIETYLLDDALYGVGDHRGLGDHDEMTGIRYHHLLAPTGRMGKRRAGFNPRCKGAQLIGRAHRVVGIEPLVPI